MRPTLTILLLLCSFTGFCQISGGQQKALNAYVDYANQSAEEVAGVVKSIMPYYPEIHRKNAWGSPRYTCPIQIDDYYFNNALKEAKMLSATVTTGLNVKLNDLRTASQNIDSKCKALDTYHKLEDYKQDNFAKAELIVTELQILIKEYRKKQFAMQTELEAVYKKLAGAQETAYTKTDTFMKLQIARERALLDLMSFNLKAEVPTGWIVDKLKQSIDETARQVDAMKTMKPALKYPAESMWGNFEESLETILEEKRRGLDEYNFEAKKSDEHSNDVYMDLINYFNGTLIANQNMFIQYADPDGYHGLKSIKYFPMYDVKSQPQTVQVDVTPFKDIPRTPLTLNSQKISISRSQFEALSDYVTFINETWRQTRYLKMVLVSFNASASYFRGLDSFEKHGTLSFDYGNFQLPQSQFQKTISGSKSLPPALAKSLNEQTEVVFGILKEMDGLCASIEIETSEKRYEKDHLKKVYEILERQKVLMDEWDNRKELLYMDVRKVYDAYPQIQPTNSWYVSGKALRTLTELDHDALFQAKSHYASNGTGIVLTDKIDETLRDVIGQEYENMKGIEKYGRSNGLCPYTPYEDLPMSSKSLSEEIKKLKPLGGRNTEHPYHRMVYQYNDIVDDYNKFCELSKQIPQLQNIKQPELFTLQYPEPTRERQQPEVSNPPAIVKLEQTTPVPSTVPPVKTKLETPVSVIRNDETTKVQHDTVYIEKRDTVYVPAPGENVRSMDGYASNNMVLLLDVSGSMNSPEKLPTLKASVLNLLSMMRLEDKISIIAFSEKPKVWLTSASFKEDAKIKKAIHDLKSSGKTDGNAGVKLAYKVADDNYIRGGNNRIILATDGEFSLNDETRRLIQKFSGEDIFLTVFNFGKGMGASKVLQGIATLGKGNYQYISQKNIDLQLIREVKAKRKK
ncbi:MAG: VWA domain-containing protein [Chryseolinea sp.]